MDGQHRLAECLGALSLATDRARGQAPESALGATILATRLAERMGLAGEQLANTYFAALTRTIGCTSMAMDVAPLALGDDLSFSYAIHMSDLADPASVRNGLETHFAVTADADNRAAAIDTVLEMHAQFPHMAAPIDQQSAALSQRLPLPPTVTALLADLDARWDGKNPTKPGGEDIPLIVRVIELTTVIELYRRAGGLQAALDVASGRSGGQFDPQVCAAFERHAPELIEGFDQISLWEVFLDAEPSPTILIDEQARQLFAEISADFVDNKSGWFVGNSRMVAALASAASQRLGLSDGKQADVGLAGLLRDLGKCAVPNGIWDKPGPLTEREVALTRTHSQHTEEILTQSPPVRSLARLAGSTHERRDGSGYHRGSSTHGTDAELLGASDAYMALVSDRPWRDAYSDDEAAEILDREADQGRISAAVVAAVLEAAGHRGVRAIDRRPDGLTPREVEVLELLARGLLTKEIASKLGIAYKTTDNHVQNLYRKIGANTRTAAAMYAVEQGIYSDQA